MSMQISVEQLNGKTLVLEVTPEMRMREVKQQIKDMQTWEDELSRDTTVVEIIFGDRKLGNDETVAEVGLSADSVVTGLLRQNVACCTNKSGFGQDMCPETLVIVEIPDSVTKVGEYAFAGCKDVAKVTIPSSVRRIGGGAFADCSALRHVTIPNSMTSIGKDVFLRCAFELRSQRDQRGYEKWRPNPLGLQNPASFSGIAWWWRARYTWRTAPGYACCPAVSCSSPRTPRCMWRGAWRSWAVRRGPESLENSGRS